MTTTITPEEIETLRDLEDDFGKRVSVMWSNALADKIEAMQAENAALKKRIEELEAEAAKNRRVFVWEFPWKDSNNVLRICWSESLRFYLTMSDSCLELIDTLTGDPFDCYDIHGDDKIGVAEQMIRELGFARPGDTFDRSKVTP